MNNSSITHLGRGRQARGDPRNEGRIHGSRDQKKWRRRTSRQKQRIKEKWKQGGSSSVVCLEEQRTTG